MKMKLKLSIEVEYEFDRLSDQREASMEDYLTRTLKQVSHHAASNGLLLGLADAVVEDFCATVERLEYNND
jgi:hypothetical protein